MAPQFTVSTGRMIWIAVAILPVMAGPGCTLVKPVIGSVSHPVNSISERLEEAESDDEDDYNDMPLPILAPTVVVLLPAHLALLSATGVVAGVSSGLASDMNVIVGNADWDNMNLHRPFKTNARKPSDD